MTSSFDTVSELVDLVAELPVPRLRNLVAIAGPPASGKSTIANALCDALNARGRATGLVAMDGFHLDNTILDARGLRARKGAPETFDLAGFSALITRLTLEEEVIVPTFDRERDLSIGNRTVVSPQMKTLIVEGNYLLLNAPGWRDLSRYWSLSVELSAERSMIEQRLIQRWLHFGFDMEHAQKKVWENDLPNAEIVLNNSRPADITLRV